LLVEACIIPPLIVCVILPHYNKGGEDRQESRRKEKEAKEPSLCFL